MNARFVLLVAVLGSMAAATTLVGRAVKSSSRQTIEAAKPANPHGVLGNKACVK